MVSHKFARFVLVLALLFLMGSDEAQAAFKRDPPKKKKKEKEEVVSSAELEKQGQAKLRELEALEASSQNGIIQFDFSSYFKYVVKNPRPYDVIMMYSVQANCEHCLDVMEEYKQTSYSFGKDRYKAKATNDKKIFFGVIYFAQDKKI